MVWGYKVILFCRHKKEKYYCWPLFPDFHYVRIQCKCHRKKCSIQCRDLGSSCSIYRETNGRSTFYLNEVQYVLVSKCSGWRLWWRALDKGCSDQHYCMSIDDSGDKCDWWAVLHLEQSNRCDTSVCDASHITTVTQQIHIWEPVGLVVVMRREQAALEANS